MAAQARVGQLRIRMQAASRGRDQAIMATSAVGVEQGSLDTMFGCTSGYAARWHVFAGRYQNRCGRCIRVRWRHWTGGRGNQKRTNSSDAEGSVQMEAGVQGNSPPGPVSSGRASNSSTRPLPRSRRPGLRDSTACGPAWVCTSCDSLGAVQCTASRRPAAQDPDSHARAAGCPLARGSEELGPAFGGVVTRCFQGSST